MGERPEDMESGAGLGDDELFALLDTHGIVRSCSAAVDARVGKPAVGSRLADVLPTSSRSAFENAWADAVGGASVSVQLEDLQLSLVPMTDGGVLVRGRSGTESRSLRMIHHALDRVAEAILWVARDSSIRYSNPAVSAYLGYSAQELSTMTVPDVNPNFEPGRWAQQWGKLASTPSTAVDTVHRTRAGALVPVRTTIQPFELDGELLLSVSVQDVAARKRLEAEARAMRDHISRRQKMEAVGTLAGGIAHDFNNILAGVVGHAELGALDATEPEMQESFGEILRACDRAKTLVGRLLTFSRPHEPTTEVVELTELVDEALSLLRAAAPAAIEIEPQLEAGLMVSCDPTALHQVVMNLGTNALHAMPEGGRLVVRLDRVDDALPHTHACARLTVSDTGCGMSAELVDRIFDPFFTTRELGDGTGLGLSVVDGVVRECGGVVRVDSEVGRGTVFTVVLPLQVNAAVTTTPAPSRPTGGSERVLVVDDEPSYRTTAARYLRRLGYEVVEAVNGIEALEVLGSGFGAMITDMNMPGMVAGTFLGRVRAQAPGMPIVVCSGFTSPREHQRVVAAGVQAFLAKPVRHYELAHALRRVLDGRAFLSDGAPVGDS